MVSKLHYEKAMTLKEKLDLLRNSSMEEHDRQFIEDVKAGRVEQEVDLPKRAKPPVPSLKGKKIVLSWKDPEAIEHSVDWFIDEFVKDIDNGDLIREEITDAVYKKISKFGEQVEVEVDLYTGKAKIL